MLNKILICGELILSIIFLFGTFTYNGSFLALNGIFLIISILLLLDSLGRSDKENHRGPYNDDTPNKNDSLDKM